MKYIAVDWKDGDMFTEEFETKEEAIKCAEKWEMYLTDKEKKTRDIYVLESANPDEDAPDHLDGNEVWRIK